MDKVQNIILSVLSAIAKIPEFLLPTKWKGWRTIAFNALSGVILALLAFDVQGSAEAVCNLIEAIVHTWNGEYLCNPTGVITGWASVTVVLNAALRTITDTAVGKPNN